MFLKGVFIMKTIIALLAIISLMSPGALSCQTPPAPKGAIIDTDEIALNMDDPLASELAAIASNDYSSDDDHGSSSNDGSSTSKTTVLIGIALVAGCTFALVNAISSHH